jgi:2-keto-3-deoxy-L-rhamnonate aldolase RhmA
MPNNVGENQAKRKLEAGALTLFMGVNQMRTPNIAMIAAACGSDGVYIDLEHNPTSLETAAAICVAALGLGITPIARVSSRDPHDATRILDCGAQGVMVPHVSTVAEARAVVETADIRRGATVRPRVPDRRSAMPHAPRQRSILISMRRPC